MKSMLRLRSWASSMMMALYLRSSLSRWISASRMPSVMSLTLVDRLTSPVKRTWKPTSWPISTPSSSAMRSATVRAASRRGWVWPISPFSPRPSSRHILGIWVVLPEPVSPAMMVTWLAAMAAIRSSRRSETGSSAG